MKIGANSDPNLKRWKVLFIPVMPKVGYFRLVGEDFVENKGLPSLRWGFSFGWSNEEMLLNSYFFSHFYCVVSYFNYIAIEYLIICFFKFPLILSWVHLKKPKLPIIKILTNKILSKVSFFFQYHSNKMPHVTVTQGGKLI